MSAFNKYQDEVLITGIPTGSWQVVDLSSYLTNPDAIGVTVRTGGNALVQGARAVGETVLTSGLPAPTISPNFIVPFVGAGKNIEIFISAGASAYITGEISGPDVKFHDTLIFHDIVEAQFSTWVLHQPTPIGGDALADIGAVILVAIPLAAGSSAMRAGAREKGSSDTEKRMPGNSGANWLVIGISDDTNEYETFSSGKAAANNEDIKWYETGYILKTSNVFTFTDRIPLGLSVPVGPYGVLDLSAHIPTTSLIAGGQFANTATAFREGFLRATGSTTDRLKDIAVAASGVSGSKEQHVALSAGALAEYMIETSQVDFSLRWYEDIPPIPPEPPAPPRIPRGPRLRTLDDDGALSASIAGGSTVSIRELRDLQTVSAMFNTRGSVDVLRLRAPEFLSARLEQPNV